MINHLYDGQDDNSFRYHRVIPKISVSVLGLKSVLEVRFYFFLNVIWIQNFELVSSKHLDGTHSESKLL